MAKQIITKLIDDLDGGEASETLTFALDGISYQIDLSSKNSKKMRDFLDPYIQAGTRTGRIGNGAQLMRHQPTIVRSTAAVREENHRIREWAANNGYEVAERGAIAQSIREAYEAKRPNPVRTLDSSEPVHSTETPEKKPAARKTAAKVAAPATTRKVRAVAFSGKNAS